MRILPRWIFLVVLARVECWSLSRLGGGGRVKPRLPTQFALNEFPTPGDAKGALMHTEMGDLAIKAFLGKGSYGSVFLAEVGGKRVALKIEKPGATKGCIIGSVPSNYLGIEHEVRVLRQMAGTPGFPAVFAHNFEGQFKYYVMPMFDINLSGKRKQAADKRINTREVIRLAFQMLDRVEAFHQRGLLMYDIHQGNFMLRGDDVFVIDPGMAIPFLDVNGNHIPDGASPLSSVCKQKTYSSRGDMAGRAVSRRDDLERLIYVLVDVNTNALPWGSDTLDWDQVSHLKQALSVNKICSGKAKWLRPALEYVLSLSFDANPDYGRIRGYFHDELMVLNERRKRREVRKR